MKKIILSAAFVSAFTALSTGMAQLLPDLTVTRVDASQVTGDYQLLTIDGAVMVHVRNIGTTSSRTCRVALFEDLNGNGHYDANTDNLLGFFTLPPLSSGELHAKRIGVSGQVRFRDSLIHVCVDTLNTVQESNEQNNCSHSGTSCIYAPPIGELNPILKWAWTSSSVEPTMLNAMMTPAVIDLDGDGIPEIIFGTTASIGGENGPVGILRAVRGDTGTEFFNITDINHRITTAGSVAVGDIDNDGRPEIIAVRSSSTQLIAFEHDGTFKWFSSTIEINQWGALAIADLNGDGIPEIISGRQVLNANGVLLWTGTGGRGQSSFDAPISIVADVNMDGTPNVIAGNTVYRNNGTILWQNTALPDGWNAVGNFDDDSFPEIVLIANGSVWLLEHTGTIKWGPVIIPGGGIGGPPTVANYDNDDEPEIGVAGASRYVVFEDNGTVKWQAVIRDGSSHRTGSSVFDFDGDGAVEVVYRDETHLWIFRGVDGHVLHSTPISSCTWTEYVLVVDVDADHSADIVAVANNNCGFGPQRGLYVFSSADRSWMPTRPIWNQHSYHITNINDDGSIPRVEQNNWFIYNNYRQNLLPDRQTADAPDLTSSYTRLECNEGAIRIMARIGNGGATGVPAGVKVGFYDGDPNTDGTLLAMTETVNTLPPGGYEEVQIWLPIGSIIADALYVFADAEDDYQECREDNNLHHSGIRYRAGDVNGDGCVDDADLLAVLFAFGCSEGCGPEDLSCDGVVDDADLLLVLFNFGSGC